MSEDRASIDERTRYGGQAVVEGVMMRSPNYFAIACRRRSTGAIETHVEVVPKGIAALGWLNKPFLRGTFALIDTMALGIRSLTYAANIQIDDEAVLAANAAGAAASQGGAANAGVRTPDPGRVSRLSEAVAAGAVDLAMGEGAPVRPSGVAGDPSRMAATLAGAPLAAASPRNGSTPSSGVEFNERKANRGKASASQNAQRGPSQSVTNIAIGATTVLAMIIGIGLFWTFPGFLADLIVGRHGHHAAVGAHTHGQYLHQIGASLIEGVIRLVIFFAYLLLISRMANVQRVFEYHGAEHKAINTLEARLPLTVENARGVTRIHPRCGTNFIFIVLTTSIVVFSVIPRYTLSDGLGLMLTTHLYRILLMPIVAGIAYELLKFAGANRDKKWALALVAPGLWTQYLTTREPDDSQIEVAIASLQSVWDKEHQVQPPSAAGTDPAAAAVA